MLDPVGNRLQVTDGSGVLTSYTYDALNQLTSATRASKNTSYAYDAVGNRTSLTAPSNFIAYSYDAADRLLTAGNTTFMYDANGNQIQNAAPSGTTTYAYDAANRLISATGKKSNSQFAYDGDGNRVSQSVGLGTYAYLNDVATALPVVLQESGPDGNISYAYGLGLISETALKFDFFYQYDGLGSVVGLTDSTAHVVGRYLYDAWGQTDLTVSDAEGTKNKFRFTGEALDPGTGLYYLRARYYDPSVGRFITKDPFAGVQMLPESLNRYQYVLANPVRYRDSSGLVVGDTSRAQLDASEIIVDVINFFTSVRNIPSISAGVAPTVFAFGVYTSSAAVAASAPFVVPVFTLSYAIGLGVSAIPGVKDVGGNIAQAIGTWIAGSTRRFQDWSSSPGWRWLDSPRLQQLH